MKIEQRHIFIEELLNIQQLLISEDEESVGLGYSLFQSSKFRKYVRNKVYAFRSTPKNIKKFPLYPLCEIKNIHKEWRKNIFETINDNKIDCLLKIIRGLILDQIIIYDRARFRKQRKRRINVYNFFIKK